MKQLTILLAVCTGLLLTSCGGGKVENTPEAVAKAFYGKIQKGDFSGAKKYATKTSAQALEMMESMMSMAKSMGGSSKTEEIEKMKNAKVEFGAAKVDGDRATIAVTTDGKAKDLNLKKEDGNWKVVFDKSANSKDNGGSKSNPAESLEDAGKQIGDMTDSLNQVMDKLNDPKVKEAMEKLADPKNMEKLNEAAEKLKDLQ